MFQAIADLVLKLFAIDAAPAATGTSGITSLDHEVGYDTVEDIAVVVASAG